MTEYERLYEELIYIRQFLYFLMTMIIALYAKITGDWLITIFAVILILINIASFLKVLSKRLKKWKQKPVIS